MTADSLESATDAVSVRSPKPEDYRLFIEREWADLHHSRVQEWTALGVVVGAHVGILQLLNLTQEATVSVPFWIRMSVGCLVGILFSIVGILVTCRHRRLMQVKLAWIFQAEDRLGLIKRADCQGGIVPESALSREKLDRRGISWPRFLSTSWLICCFYLLLAVFDLLGVVVFAIS